MSDKTYTQDEMNAAMSNTILIERYLAWHSISIQRSRERGDAPHLVEAAQIIAGRLMAPAAPPAPKEDEPKTVE